MNFFWFYMELQTVTWISLNPVSLWIHAPVEKHVELREPMKLSAEKVDTN
jgi:hypothetical protein